MIRIILYRVDGTGEWNEGVVHVFVDGHCVVENKATGELNLVPVKPENLKFKILTEQWVAMQIEAQRQAQSRSVLAGPPPPDFRR
jgi:hypothetical protein